LTGKAASRAQPAGAGHSGQPRQGGPAPGDEATAYRVLASAEPVVARLVSVYGHPDPFEWSDGGRTGSSPFTAMVLHITGQRISAAAAFTVFDRITAAGGNIPGPETLLALGADPLRALGLSRAKAGCLLELASRQAAGIIDLENMGALSDDEVTSALTAVPASAFGPHRHSSSANCAARTSCRLGTPAYGALSPASGVSPDRPPHARSRTGRQPGRPIAATRPLCCGGHFGLPTSHPTPRPALWPAQRGASPAAHGHMKAA
jgi:hypothetical protein